jgi:hypothetical protein
MTDSFLKHYGEKIPRKKEETIDYPDKSHVQLKSKSGWCADKLHNQCKYQFTFGKCGCDCHKEKK